MVSPLQPNQRSADEPLHEPVYRFAFDGRLGDVLQHFIQEDARYWKLSWKFRCYYRMRRWIPVGWRQYLQQTRNRQLPVGDAWYYHHPFWQEFKAALQLECQGVPPAVVHPWPDGLEHAAVLTHDVEAAAGLPRVDKLARLEEQMGLRSAWYFVPAKYRIDVGMLKDLQARGHEVAVHGYNHDGRLFTSRELFRRRAAEINRVARAWQATGFRSPMMHRQLSWMQALEIDYDASCFDIDPYQAMPGGVGGVWPFVAGKFVELPCTLPQDHTLFVTLQRHTTEIWKHKYALLRSVRGMAMSLVHPDYLDTPQRWDLYRELLDQFAAAEDGWKCLPREVAQWWRAREASNVTEDSVVGPAQDRGRAVKLADLFSELLAESPTKA